MNNWKKFAYLGFCGYLSSCASFQNLTLSEIDTLTTCDISLTEAKQHLLTRGYGIISESEDQFTTDYRKSEFESWVTTFTKEPVVDTHRRMVVFSDGQNKVRFTFKYRRIEYPNKFARLGNPEFTVSEKEDYVEIQKEVCNSPLASSINPAS